MQLHRSNRAEALVDALGRVVGAPQDDAFAEACIVVQGRGIERWLSLELSERLGIFAHARFPFPRAFLQQALVAVTGDDAEAGAAWEPEALAWAIADLLPAHLTDPGFEPIRTYLAEASPSVRDGEAPIAASPLAERPNAGARDAGLRDIGSDEKLIALAARIAEAFDHYAVYRPEMVLAWEGGDDAATRRWAGTDSAWQSILWRELSRRLGLGHVAARVRRLIDALDSGAQVGPQLPRRVCLFGLSTLPPLYVSAFSALGRQIDLHAFVLSPSREYWGWIRSERETLKLRGHASGHGDIGEPHTAAELHIEEGHPLLASLGRVGRDFQEILEERTDYHESDEDLYADPSDPAQATDAQGDRASLLHTIQSDILALRTRGGPNDVDPAVVLDRDDHSVAIHACHGPMREAEVLRDQLLDLFARDPSLEPHDVVVMSPDAALYAPFVEAAFAPEAAGGPSIPVRAADRGARAAFPVVEAFGRILDVLGGRLAAGEVLELLAIECVRAHFGITAEDEGLLRAWIDRSGIRWGIDAEHRAREGQPRAVENTWRFGLDRLFVGMAIEDAPGRMFGDVVPQAGVEGGEAVTLGRLADLTEALFSLHVRAREPRPLAEWAELFSDALDRMIEVDGDRIHERSVVVEAIDDLARTANHAGHTGRVPLGAAREAVARFFDRAVTTGGFVTGAVTVCEMLPMRSIPFRVVALLGLNDEAFPRARRRPGFDLIGARRRPGDRSARDDDRQMFLEALLSARDHLLITYVGRDIRNNESKPPSVVIDELLDHVGRIVDTSGPPRERLVVEHPLQPWSPRYFEDSDPDARLFSYSAPWSAAARELAGPDAAPTLFVAEPLASPAAGSLEPDAELSLDALKSFFVAPARHFVRDVLGLRLEEAEEVGPEREPLDIEGLEAFGLGQEMLELALAGGDPAGTRRRFAGQGKLPLGEAGRAAHAELVAEVTAIAKRVLEARGGDALPLADLVLDCGGVRVSGRVDGMFPGGRVAARFARLERPSELDVWISHLALCADTEAGRAEHITSHLVGRASSRDAGHAVFRDVAGAGALLADLVAIYRVGCTRPLPLFPSTSRRYAQIHGRSRDAPDREERAMLEAYAVYGESEPGRPESQDAYVRQLFANVDPLAPSHRPVGVADDATFGFGGLALRVFAPLLAHREAPK